MNAGQFVKILISAALFHPYLGCGWTQPYVLLLQFCVVVVVCFLTFLIFWELLSALISPFYTLESSTVHCICLFPACPYGFLCLPSSYGISIFKSSLSFWSPIQLPSSPWSCHLVCPALTKPKVIFSLTLTLLCEAAWGSEMNTEFGDKQLCGLIFLNSKTWSVTFWMIAVKNRW